MIKLSENKLYAKIIEEFEIDDNEVDLKLKVNAKTNEFVIEGISVFTPTYMINVHYYSNSTDIYLIERTPYGVEAKTVSVKLEANADVEEVITIIKENI